MKNRYPLSNHLLSFKSIITNSKYRSSEPIFWRPKRAPVRHGVRVANRPKGCPGCLLSVDVSKTLDQPEKLEPFDL